jgi:hypothetical protein
MTNSQRTIDVFPAKLVINQETTIGKVRARLVPAINGTAPHLMVWQEQQAFPHNPALIVDAPVSILNNSIGNMSVVRRKQQLAVATSTGQQYVISAQPGCGCGSRLKALSNAQLSGQAYQPIYPAIPANPADLIPDYSPAIAANWPHLVGAD